MELKAGSKLASSVCATEVIVVKAPADGCEVCCGGQPMTAPGGEAPGGEADPAFTEGTLMGKRYGSDELGIELLCTKPGEGSLSVNGEALPLKEAKPLPSSD